MPSLQHRVNTTATADESNNNNNNNNNYNDNNNFDYEEAQNVRRSKSKYSLQKKKLKRNRLRDSDDDTTINTTFLFVSCIFFMSFLYLHYSDHSMHREKRLRSSLWKRAKKMMQAREGERMEEASMEEANDSILEKALLLRKKRRQEERLEKENKHDADAPGLDW